MILRGNRFEIRSQNSNLVYWEQEEFPSWTALNCLRLFTTVPSGHGVEPHYHDNDEIWLFRSGRGEVWVGGEKREVTPNTMVYTPMGVVHRFQMFEPWENTAIVTRLEGKKRAAHILVEEDGEPVPAAEGFVVPGAENRGPLADPGSRCPLSEFREIHFDAGETLAAEGSLQVNEHWLVSGGEIELSVDGAQALLVEEDVALMKAGAVRAVRAITGGRAILVRER